MTTVLLGRGRRLRRCDRGGLRRARCASCGPTRASWASAGVEMEKRGVELVARPARARGGRNRRAGPRACPGSLGPGGACRRRCARRAAGSRRAGRLVRLQSSLRPARPARRRADALLRLAPGLGLAPRPHPQARAARRSHGGDLPLRARRLRRHRASPSTSSGHPAGGSPARRRAAGDRASARARARSARSERPSWRCCPAAGATRCATCLAGVPEGRADRSRARSAQPLRAAAWRPRSIAPRSRRRCGDAGARRAAPRRSLEGGLAGALARLRRRAAASPARRRSRRRCSAARWWWRGAAPPAHRGPRPARWWRSTSWRCRT